MHVITRIDFRGAQEYRYNIHPDWFAMNADGSPKKNQQGLHAPCYVGKYANDYAVEFIKKLMSTFPIDGIWENAVMFGQGPCYCRACKEAYYNDLKKEIPVGDFSSSDFDEYRVWKSRKASDHINLIKNTVKLFGEDKAYSAEVFGMYHKGGSFMTGIDTYAAKNFDYVVGVGFLSGGTNGNAFDELTYASSAVRFLKSIDDQKTTVLLTGNNGTRWRLIKDPSLETRLWMWEAASAGGNFWNCMFNGQHPDNTVDRRNSYIEKDVYKYLMDNEGIVQNQSPVKDVAIYFSKKSRDRFGDENEKIDLYGVGIKGIESILIAHHIQYGFINDSDLSIQALSDIRVLVLPNAACLSKHEMDVFTSYVEMGGHLMMSYETSLYDENGKQRADFGLKELMGLSYTGIKKNTEFDHYQMIREPEHPILSDMGTDRTAYLMNGSETLLTTPTDDKGIAVCTYIPMIKNQWPEQAWIRITETSFPTIYTHNYGKGKVVYFANRMDALAYTNGHEDYQNILFNTLNFLSDGDWTLKTSAPDSVTASLRMPSKMRSETGEVEHRFRGN